MGFVEAGASFVLGIENNPDDVAKARALVRLKGLEERLDFMTRVPLARELFTSHVNCVLTR